MRDGGGCQQHVEPVVTHSSEAYCSPRLNVGCLVVDATPLRRFPSASAYNAAYPAALVPADPAARHRLRGYHNAMRGVVDDLTGSDASMTVDFLPGGPPVPGETDRIGTVVASRWRRDTFVVLAEDISLRSAWREIIKRWPSGLSAVHTILEEVAAAHREAIEADL